MLVRITDFSSLTEEKERLKNFLTAEDVSERVVFAGKLVLCELVGNILRHSAAFAEVESKIENGFFEMIVRASDGYLPPPKSSCSDVFSEGGRGLFIVDEICASRTCTKDGVCVRIRLENEK